MGGLGPPCCMCRLPGATGKDDEVQILVTGATGLIGRALCARLGDQGADLITVSRAGRHLPATQRALAIDLEHQVLPLEVLRGVETVYHLAGIAHQQAPAERYQRLNVEATLALAQSALDAGVRTFVFVSSVKAMGPAQGNGPRTESQLSPAPDPYGRSKREAEVALSALLAGSGTRLIILRPALVYAPDARGNLRWMHLAARLGLPRPPALGGRSMIGVEDLARLLCQLPAELALTDSSVHCMIATDGECYSSQRIHDGLRSALGRQPSAGRGSRLFWRAAGRALDLLQANPPGSSAEKLFGWELYSNRLLLETTTWRPRQTLETMVKEWMGEGAP